MSDVEPQFEYAIRCGDRFAAFNCNVLRNPYPAMGCFFDAIGMISQPTDPDALGFDPLPDPSTYRKNNYLGEYQYTLKSALAYVTQDGIADATPKQFARIAKQSLLMMLADHPVPAPEPGFAPLAWVLIELPSVKFAPRRELKHAVKRERDDGPVSDRKLMRDLRDAGCI